TEQGMLGLDVDSEPVVFRENPHVLFGHDERLENDGEIVLQTESNEDVQLQEAILASLVDVPLNGDRMVVDSQQPTTSRGGTERHHPHDPHNVLRYADDSD